MDEQVFDQAVVHDERGRKLDGSMGFVQPDLAQLEDIGADLAQRRVSRLRPGRPDRQGEGQKEDQGGGANGSTVHS